MTWGVDISTVRIAFATSSGVSASVEIPKRLKGVERLSVARTAVWHHCREFAVKHPPLCVWVERPTGARNRTHHSLTQMEGVVSEAVYASLKTLYNHPVSVFPIAVTSWKKASVGHGNATIQEYCEWAESWAKPANEDEAAALGVAVAGQSMIAEAA